MVRGYRTLREFLNDGEAIASNILAARLHELEDDSIINVENPSKMAAALTIGSHPKALHGPLHA